MYGGRTNPVQGESLLPRTSGEATVGPLCGRKDEGRLPALICFSRFRYGRIDFWWGVLRQHSSSKVTILSHHHSVYGNTYRRPESVDGPRMRWIIKIINWREIGFIFWSYEAGWVIFSQCVRVKTWMCTAHWELLTFMLTCAEFVDKNTWLKSRKCIVNIAYINQKICRFLLRAAFF